MKIVQVGLQKTLRKLSIISPKIVQKLMVGFPTSNLSIMDLVEVFYEYLAYVLLIKLDLPLKDVLDFDMNVID